MINNKKFNLLDLEFISVKSIENYAYKDLFEKYGIINYKDLETRINDGTIKDKFLEESVLDVKQGIGVRLSDISTDSLRINDEMSEILDRLKIFDFQKLSEYIANDNQIVMGNMFLLNGFKMVTTLLEEAKDKKKAR